MSTNHSSPGAVAALHRALAGDPRQVEEGARHAAPAARALGHQLEVHPGRGARSSCCLLGGCGPRALGVVSPRTRGRGVGDAEDVDGVEVLLVAPRHRHRAFVSLVAIFTLRFWIPFHEAIKLQILDKEPSLYH